MTFNTFRALGLIWLSIGIVLWTEAPSAFAKSLDEKDEASPLASGPEREFLWFKSLDLNIDCADLGGPNFSGDYVSSDEASLEILSNVPVSMTYTSSFGLRNGTRELPTWIQVSAQGAGNVDGVPFSSPGIFTAYGVLPAYKLGDSSGWAAFQPLAQRAKTIDAVKKGLKVRLVAQRNGLLDPGGYYAAEIILTYCRM